MHDAEQLLARLEGGCSVADERASHRRSGWTTGAAAATTPHAAAAAAAPEEVTFF